MYILDITAAESHREAEQPTTKDKTTHLLLDELIAVLKGVGVTGRRDVGRVRAQDFGAAAVASGVKVGRVDADLDELVVEDLEQRRPVVVDCRGRGRGRGRPRAQNGRTGGGD